jgi:hypothetical protein
MFYVQAVLKSLVLYVRVIPSESFAKRPRNGALTASSWAPQASVIVSKDLFWGAFQRQSLLAHIARWKWFANYNRSLQG